MTPDANDLCVFAVKRGIITGRFDVRNMHYSSSDVSTKREMVSLGSLTLEEPCYGASATALPRTNEQQPKYIRITDFDDYGIEHDHEYMTADGYSERHFLRHGDILFARSGATVGKTFYYSDSIGPAVFAGYCIRFRFSKDKVNPKFVYWYTKTGLYSAWVKGVQRPSGQPNINKEEFKSFQILVPNKDKQNALITIMDVAEQKREEAIQYANETLNLARKRLLSEIGVIFSDYTPSMYSYSKLGEIREIGLYCNPHSAYLNEVFSKLQSSHCYAGALENYLDVNPAIKKDGLSDSSLVSFVPMPAVTEKTNQVIYEQREYKDVKNGFTPFQRGDLLWAKITPCMQNGKSFLSDTMPTEFGFGSTEFHVLRPKSDKIYMPFLWVLLSDEHILEAAKGMFSGSAGQQRVSDTFLRKMPAVLPPLDVQKALADEAFVAMEKAKQVTKAAEQEWSEAKAQFEKELLGEP